MRRFSISTHVGIYSVAAKASVWCAVLWIAAGQVQPDIARLYAANGAAVPDAAALQAQIALLLALGIGLMLALGGAVVLAAVTAARGAAWAFRKTASSVRGGASHA